MPLFKRSKRDALPPDFDLMPRNFIRNANEDDNDDSASIRTYSTMATTNSNRGAGWTVDSYFYQRAGRWIESWASRIGLRYGAIPPFIITRRVHELLYPGAGFWFPDATYLSRKAGFNFHHVRKKVTILNGISCLMKQMQSPSLYRQALACTALIRITSLTPFSRDHALSVFENYFGCKTTSIKARAVAILISSKSKNRHIHTSSLLNFLHVCIEYQSVFSLKSYGNNYLHFCKSAKENLRQLVKQMQSRSYDPVLIVHEACVVLTRCFEELHMFQGGEFAEVLYYYMCFLLNVFGHELQPSNSSVEGHHIVLLPYIHWIDSHLPMAFFWVSKRYTGHLIAGAELRFILQFYSLFTLQQTRDLFPMSYVKSNFNSGQYMDAILRTTEDASSLETLVSHIQNIKINLKWRVPATRTDYLFGSYDKFHGIYDIRRTVTGQHDFMRGLWEREWPRFKSRVLDQRLWERHVNRSPTPSHTIGNIIEDRRFDLIPQSLIPPARGASDAATLGGGDIPILEYSRNSRTPMTIAFLCKETGKTIYRTVEVPSEEAEAEELQAEEEM